MINITGVHFKNWGWEDILHSTDRFCVKNMVFQRANNYFSFHYHKEKYEEWTVTNGSFKLELGSQDDPRPTEMWLLEKGDVVKMEPGRIHRLTAVEPMSIILEVSTADHMEDNVKLMPTMPTPMQYRHFNPGPSSVTETAET